MLIDTHAHIFAEAFEQDRNQVIREAIDAGVHKMLLPAIDSKSHGKLFEVADEFPEHCLPMVGLHPTSVEDTQQAQIEIEIVESLLNSNKQKIIAIGEIGIDLYWTKETFEVQKWAFQRQIEIALENNLPVVVHARSSYKEVIEVIEKYPNLRGVMHAFDGSVDDYKVIRKSGNFFFGIGGVVTFKNSNIAEVVQHMDIQDIVLETDSPYLSPVPFRGKRNKPEYVKFVCQKIAEIKKISIDHVARITSQNAERLFDI